MLCALGYDAHKAFSVSLDLLAAGSVLQACLNVVDERKVHGERRYQVCSTLLHPVAILTCLFAASAVGLGAAAPALLRT